MTTKDVKPKTVAVNFRIRADYLARWRSEAEKRDLNLSEWVALQCEGSGLLSRLESKVDKVLRAIVGNKKISEP